MNRGSLSVWSGVISTASCPRDSNNPRLLRFNIRCVTEILVAIIIATARTPARMRKPLMRGWSRVKMCGPIIPELWPRKMSCFVCVSEFISIVHNGKTKGTYNR